MALPRCRAQVARNADWLVLGFGKNQEPVAEVLLLSAGYKARAMSDKISAILEEYRARIAEHRQLLHHALEKGGQQREPQAVMLMRTVEFGLQTMNAVELLTADDASQAVAACAATRAFFEAAVRALWATRSSPDSQNPWARLQVYWALEDLKWANAASDFKELEDHADIVRAARQEVRDRRDAEGKPIQTAPPIIEMLREIDEANRAQGLGTEGCLERDYVYTNIYRLLSQGAHGHPLALRTEKNDWYLRHARIGLVMAASYLLEASCHVGATDPKGEIEALATRILGIANELPE